MDMSLDTRNWPLQPVATRERWILGWDIGQSIDPSAICALHHRIEGTGDLTPDTKARVLRQGRRERFDVRHLERLPLGTPYPRQIEHVANLLARDPLTGAKLVVDFTGVGRPIYDMAARAGLKPHGVLITAGNEVTFHEGRIHHVPKQILVSQLEARLHSGELRIASNIVDAGALKDELKDFARKVSESGRVTFNARSGAHDDLVLAVAIALFLALNAPESSTAPLRI